VKVEYNLKNVVFWDTALYSSELTDVSGECIASIFRVEISASGEQASAGGWRLFEVEEGLLWLLYHLVAVSAPQYVQFSHYKVIVITLCVDT
jgi:hypothetical protein